jgi:hypothetical protein
VVIFRSQKGPVSKKVWGNTGLDFRSGAVAVPFF